MTRARDLANWGDQVPNAETAWTAYTPTLTNLTLGNGTVDAKYKQIGKTVFLFFKFTLGSTSSVGTSPQFSLPVTGRVTISYHMLANLQDTGTADNPGMVYITTTTAVFAAINVGGTYATTSNVTSTIPFTWTTNDTITTQFTYEAA